MKPMRYGAVVVAVAIAAIIPLAIGQPRSSETISEFEGEELNGIRLALEQLVELYKNERSFRDVELILKRIDTAVSRLAPLERKLAVAEEVVRKAEKNNQTLERMKEQQEGYLEEQIREGTDMPRSETRVMLKDIERSREGNEETIEDTRLRVQEYENELAMKLKQIESLDEMLLDLLDSERS